MKLLFIGFLIGFIVGGVLFSTLIGGSKIIDLVKRRWRSGRK